MNMVFERGRALMKWAGLVLLVVCAAGGCNERELREESAARERKMQAAIDNANKAIESAKVEFKGIGRFQVINGVPAAARSIMLLDTVTGKTWAYCRDEKEETGWCSMFGGPVVF